jgi:histidinol phosphatase-like enzyme
MATDLHTENETIAVDFDGTLYDDSKEHFGTPRMDVINKLIELQKKGTKLVLWTCRGGSKLTEAIEWCKKFNLIFDAINDDLPEIKQRNYDKSAKPMVHLYLDDRAINMKEFLEKYK